MGVCMCVSPSSEPPSSNFFSSLSRYHTYRSLTECHQLHHIGTLFKTAPYPLSIPPWLPALQLQRNKFSSAKLSWGHIQISSLTTLQLVNFTAIVLINRCDKNSHGENVRSSRGVNDRLLQSPGLQLQSPQRGGRCKGVKMLLGSQQLPEGKTMAFRGNTEQHLIQKSSSWNTDFLLRYTPCIGKATVTSRYFLCRFEKIQLLFPK